MPLTNRVCFLVNLRDGLTCQRCGLQPPVKETYHRGFEYHHIIPKSEGGSDEVDNITLLCHDCHKALHQSGGDKFHPEVGSLSERFPCHLCASELDPQTISMNCGWYQCPMCEQTVHLYDHCFKQRESLSND